MSILKKKNKYLYCEMSKAGIIHNNTKNISRYMLLLFARFTDTDTLVTTFTQRIAYFTTVLFTDSVGTRIAERVTDLL